jgi:hypothetical protein
MIGLGIIIILSLIYSTYKSYNDYVNSSPYLIDGITDGTYSQQFSANQILPPSDSQYGSEFTYSFWIFIKDTNFSNPAALNCSSSSLLHVFHKGSIDYIPNGGKSTGDDSCGNSASVYYPLLQMPGVWLYPNTNKLNIRFNTYENVVETSDIGNIPLNMWVNVIVILIGSSVDIYVNGNLKKRTKLSGVPKINYGNLYTSNWGGFQGYLSRLRYFNYAIQPFLIDQIFNMGPSLEYNENSFQNDMVQSKNALSRNYWMTTGYPNSVGAPGYNQNSQTTA